MRPSRTSRPPPARPETGTTPELRSQSRPFGPTFAPTGIKRGPGVASVGADVREAGVANCVMPMAGGSPRSQRRLSAYAAQRRSLPLSLTLSLAGFLRCVSGRGSGAVGFAEGFALLGFQRLVPDVLAVTQIDDVLGDVLGVITDALEGTCAPHQVEQGAQAV